MARAGARRRRTLALLAACLVAWVPLFAPAPSSGSQPVDCLLNPQDPECASSSTGEDTSTSLDEESSTTEETPTTEGQTATSLSEPVTTAEIDDVEDLTTSTLPVTTSANLLVPGDGTEGAESTTTTTTVPATTTSDDGTSDSTLIALVIGGLIAVAVAVAFLTWRYWVATRPPPALPGA